MCQADSDIRHRINDGIRQTLLLNGSGKMRASARVYVHVHVYLCVYALVHLYMSQSQALEMKFHGPEN